MDLNAFESGINSSAKSDKYDRYTWGLEYEYSWLEPTGTEELKASLANSDSQVGQLLILVCSETLDVNISVANRPAEHTQLVFFWLV